MKRYEQLGPNVEDMYVYICIHKFASHVISLRENTRAYIICTYLLVRSLYEFLERHVATSYRLSLLRPPTLPILSTMSLPCPLVSLKFLSSVFFVLRRIGSDRSKNSIHLFYIYIYLSKNISQYPNCPPHFRMLVFQA